MDCGMNMDSSHHKMVIQFRKPEPKFEELRPGAISAIYAATGHSQQELDEFKNTVTGVHLLCKKCGEEYIGDKLPNMSLPCKCPGLTYLYYEQIMPPIPITIMPNIPAEQQPNLNWNIN